MTERPILFSAEMVRAIFGGNKTMTRRIVKPQPTWVQAHTAYIGRKIGIHEVLCPYGRKGDRLWVRETWQCVHVYIDPETGYGDDIKVAKEIPKEKDSYWRPIYAADQEYEENSWDRGFRWRPSIHMPRWASRITLEITDVRLQRLQAINEQDALAEGVMHTDFGMYTPKGTMSLDGGNTFLPFKEQRAPGWHVGPVSGPDQCFQAARNAFGNLWEHIHGDGAWDQNPWVWAISFRRLVP